MNINMAQWQDPAAFYASAHPPGYIGEPDMAPPFPEGPAYEPDMSWMQRFSDQTGDITHQGVGAFPPHHHYATAMQSSSPSPAPGDPQASAMLTSQRAYADATDESPGDERASYGSDEPGQPGSASATAASADISRRSTPSARYSSRPRLEEENRFLLELRDRQRLPWREVTNRFEQRYGREYRMPTLQMRYGRLRQASQASRTRHWSDMDTEALRQAWQWYMEERWRIISERMQHFGATEQWSAEECELAYNRLAAGNRPYGGPGT
ncbi:MAG: hypothetical protein Q9159_000667 [Coniocarpon cinnabarinum]